MKKRKDKSTMLLIMVIAISVFMNMTVMAVENFPSGVSIKTLEVYPANVDTKTVFSDYYMRSGATTNQTINITLTNKVKDYYNRNNCNGFYIKLTVANAYQASRYEAYDNNTIVDKGVCTGIPNYPQEISFFIKADRTIYHVNDQKFYGYASWKAVFYGYKSGKPLSGPIYIPLD